MTWQSAIALYKLHLKAAGKRPATITLYVHYLNHLADQLGGDPWSVTTAQLERELGVLGGGLSARKSLRTAMGGFYSWARISGHITVDPTTDLPTVKVPRGRPRPTPEGVLAEALAAATARERLMLELGALMGLRAGEIARVHRDDFDGELLLIHGKGGREREVPIARGGLVDALVAADGWLFPNGLGGHLTPNHVSKTLSALLPDPWTAHTLRHRFGTRVYRATRDLLVVSELLGHASTETTRIYVQMPADHLRAAVDSAAHIGHQVPQRGALAA